VRITCHGWTWLGTAATSSTFMSLCFYVFISLLQRIQLWFNKYVQPAVPQNLEGTAVNSVSGDMQYYLPRFCSAFVTYTIKLEKYQRRLQHSTKMDSGKHTRYSNLWERLHPIIGFFLLSSCLTVEGKETQKKETKVSKVLMESDRINNWGCTKQHRYLCKWWREMCSDNADSKPISGDQPKQINSSKKTWIFNTTVTISNLADTLPVKEFELHA
jgi:hypothetical protein